MFKRLAILGMFLLVFGSNCRADQVQAKNSNLQPTAPVLAVAQQQPNAAGPQAKDQQDIHAEVKIVNPPEKDFYDKAPFWINVALVIVGIAGVIAAVKTIKKIERQAKAAEDAAKASRDSAAAALQQANVLVDAERAWIVESIQFVEEIPYRPAGGGVITARVTIKNIGKQPAFLKLAQLRFHSVEGVLPETPQYAAMQTFTDGFMVAPNQEKYLRAALEEGSFDNETVDRIRGSIIGKPLKLYIYGCVIYLSMGKTGINQFCYKWNNQMGFSWADAKPYFEKDGPIGYNRHT